MKICVLGGGNGAFAAAAHLSKDGHKLNMYSPFPEEIKPIKDEGGIILKGCLGEHFVEGINICNEPEEAVKGTEIVMVVVPAIAHEYYARLIAPLLEDDQILFLDPGHTGGALHVKQCLKEEGLKADIKLLETNTLTYIARKTGVVENEVTIYKIASHIIMSALPASDTEYTYGKIKELYPGLTPARNVLETSLTNLNAILHPPGMILNAAHIERTKGNFYFYSEGTTEAVGTTMKKLDLERMTVLEALELPKISFIDHFYEGGYTTKEAYESGSYYRIVKESPPNTEIKSPSSLEDRFIEEDIRCGLVPMASLAELFNVQTPLMDSLITMAGVINDKDYFKEGLNLTKLGLDDLKPAGVQKYVNKGLK